MWRVNYEQKKFFFILSVLPAWVEEEICLFERKCISFGKPIANDDDDDKFARCWAINIVQTPMTL